MNGKKVERQGGKSPRTNHPHAEVVPDPERLPFIAATRWQMHLFPAFRPDGAGTESPVRTFHTDTPAPHGMGRAGRGMPDSCTTFSLSFM